MLLKETKKQEIDVLNTMGTNVIFAGLIFKKKSVEIGEKIFHAHHLKSFSEINNEYIVNPINDLVPVYLYYHAMIHRKAPPFTKLEFI